MTASARPLESRPRASTPRTVDRPAEPRSSTDWCRHFDENRRALLPVPWKAAELTPEESAAIAESLRGFQAGESSEGRHLLRYARDYARRTRDYNYVEAIRFFIAEEQRHARTLARFLMLNGIPLQKTNGPDRVFRKLRNLLRGLECSICVLLTAEIIALVYYDALHEATGSRTLRVLCRQILRDEEMHVRFQAEQVGRLRAGRARPWTALAFGVQRVLFRGTCVVVWAFHRRALRRGGLSFPGFWRRCRSEFDRTMRMTREAMRTG